MLNLWLYRQNYFVLNIHTVNCFYYKIQKSGNDSFWKFTPELCNEITAIDIFAIIYIMHILYSIHRQFFGWYLIGIQNVGNSFSILRRVSSSRMVFDTKSFPKKWHQYTNSCLLSPFSMIIWHCETMNALMELPSRYIVYSHSLYLFH